MIFGVSSTKSAVVIAESKGAGGKFVPKEIRPVPFQVRLGQDQIDLLKTLGAIFDGERKGAGSIIALLKCSSGRFGSCLESIKGEAMVEFAAAQGGHRVVKVATQSLKKAWAVRRIKSGGTAPGNCSILKESVRTGPRAQPEQWPSPSRSRESDEGNRLPVWLSPSGPNPDGLHWASLQTVAWAGMIVTYTHESGTRLVAGYTSITGPPPSSLSL